MQKILIAPWGKFDSWSDVIYSFDGVEKESISSISAIYDKIKPDKVFILVLDTLSHLESENYGDIIKEVKEKTENFIKENLEIDNYEVIVCPGVGTFFDKNTKKTYKFLGNLIDYYSFVLYKLAKKLNGDLEVHLDLTHGVNYMPVLTYKAVRELLEILAIKYRAKLVVYNSDPYGNIKTTLNINIVENSHIPARPSLDKITPKFLGINAFVDKNERGKLGKEINQNNKIIELKNMKQNINVFLASFVYALPLIYSTFSVKKEVIEDKVNEIMNIFMSNIVIDSKNRELKRLVKFENGFNALVKAYFTSKISENREFIKDELSLKEIEDMSEILFKLNSLFIKNEVNSICKSIKNYVRKKEKLREWIPLYELFENDELSEFKIRNFLAHGGLERNIVEIYIDIEDDKIEEIKNNNNKNKEVNKYIKEKTLLRYNKSYTNEIELLKQIEKEFCK
ncbi:CRISPR-associated CARF protein Csx1 [Methanocaldococcus fervens]|uniref:CRISPR-associated protein, MJ1666 family n=1 Tax=Methanocaldococcus fervens (strain DSM 4213 / JCM 15782 / AG86) TaxID=573064 RepID=C7P8A2_METFA|nr:CRISPR-associated CARF protein Csx1 [Methanocaldococcus fervens]ACV24784.1 CRISPR-associated protein, MJ1666 family [Methanocaldococcus fervens AG86]